MFFDKETGATTPVSFFFTYLAEIGGVVMWTKIKKYIGYAWAAPMTIFGLVYVGLYTIMGWYRWHGVEGNALIWIVNSDEIPNWLTAYWKKLNGHASGNVVVLKHPPDVKATILKHEQKHVDQFMRLGLFWPIFYYGIEVAIKFGCVGSDPYYDNPFEIDARRHAGQLVDIVGMRNKYIESKK
jgi:hypothetical protein